MFQVKICGITQETDALAAVDAGADAIGLNFYERSPRFIGIEQARVISDLIPPGVVKVGVFVNAAPNFVCQTFDELELDAIQLHGDEPPAMLGLLRDRPVIRAFRCKSSGLEPVLTYLEQCDGIGSRPSALLIDAFQPGQYGGTGRLADWSSLENRPKEIDDYDIVLAGGLTPANVAEAIRLVRPSSVDTASGVESSAGKKDPEMMRRFVSEAKTAFT